jgi:hypothetical protein
MTLLDSGGVGGGSGEVTTLSRPMFHGRNGGNNSSNKQKQQLTTSDNYNSSDINANTTTVTNGNYSNPESGVQRVPEIASQCQMLLSHGDEHDLKKWSEVCKMSPDQNGYKNSTTNNSTSNSSNGDSNNNLSDSSAGGGTTSATTTAVLPEMDFSN